MIEFNCSNCRKQLRVKEEAPGKRGKCPQCGTSLLVPEPETVILEAVEPSTTPPLRRTGDELRGPRQSVPMVQASRRHRRWVAVLIVVAVVAIPFVPKLTLWLGVILLLLCSIAFIPRIRAISHRLLRLNPGQKWRSAARLTMFGFAGLVLVLGSFAGAEFKAEQERIAAERQAEEAAQRKLSSEANRTVAAYVREAEAAWQRDDLMLAGRKLAEAEKTPHATEFSPVRRLRVRMANAEVESLVADAIAAVQIGDLEDAKAKVTDARAVPYADDIADARELATQIDLATDPDSIREALKKLPVEVFNAFHQSGDLPPQLVSGHEELDVRTAEIARVNVAGIAADREQRRLEERAREQAAAEAARKAEEERRARQLAKQEAAQDAVQDRLDAYVALLNAAEVRLIDNVSVRRIGDSIWEATLKVENLWHIRHYQIRLQDAQTLWEAWAGIASPKQPDSARIKIVDQRGNEVGGSRVWGGSLIWVDED